MFYIETRERFVNSWWVAAELVNIMFPCPRYGARVTVVLHQQEWGPVNALHVPHRGSVNVLHDRN